MSKSSAFIATTAILTGLLIAGPLVAGTPGLDQREHNQRQRIVHGVRSGELTRPEAHRLVHGQVHLRRMEMRAKSDQVVTARERARLHSQANQQSQHIFRQKHDPQDRN